MSALDLFASALGGFVLVAILLFPYYNKYSIAETARIEAEAARDAAQISAATATEAAEAARQAEADAQRKQVAAESQLAQTQSDRDEARQRADEAESAAAQAQAALSDAQDAVAQLTQAAQEQEQRIDQLLLEVARTFLIIQIQWQLNFDVDMYVTDPAGRLFYYSQSNGSGQDYPGVLTQLSIDNTYGPGIEVWQAPEADPGAYAVEYRLLGATGGIEVPVSGKAFHRNGVVPMPDAVLTDSNPTAAFTVTVTEDGGIEVTQ